MTTPLPPGASSGWLDCSSGVSGDMLLGALADLGALDDLPDVVDDMALPVRVDGTATRRGGLRAVQIVVEADGKQPLRKLPDLLAILEKASVPDAVQHHASAVFRRLAAAEAHVHGIAIDEVHFHEVGALDTVVDVVGVCLGVHRLALGALHCSPIALGSGSAATSHGTVSVPVPAVLALLTETNLVGTGGPVDVELATPTGVALLAELVSGCGPMPAMRVARIGVGAGARELAGQANVVRLVIGELADTTVAANGAPTPATAWLLLEANVDDLDPRLWPTVLENLLVAGAADAWLTPILMKKGRPAHTLSALVEGTDVDAVRDVMFRESSTIGVRTTQVGKHALDRESVTVDVEGQPIRVKVGRLAAQPVSVTPEWEDVAAAARALSRPAKTVLAAAVAAAESAVH